MKEHRTALVWFRRDLRLADNPALMYAVANAAHIIPVTTDATVTSILAGSGKTVTAGYLDASASGIVWCQTGCNIGSGQVVGSPDHPVLRCQQRWKKHSPASLALPQGIA